MFTPMVTRAQTIIGLIDNIALEELNTTYETEMNLFLEVLKFADLRTLDPAQLAKYQALTKGQMNATFDLPQPDSIPGPIAIGVSLAILERIAQKLQITVEETEQTPVTSTEHEIVYYWDELNLTRIKQLVSVITAKLN